MRLSQLEALVKRMKEQSHVADPYVSFWISRSDIPAHRPGLSWSVDFEVKSQTLEKADLRDDVTQDGEYQLPLKVKG